LFEAIDHGLSVTKVCFGSADMQQTCQLFKYPCAEARRRLFPCLRRPCRQAAGKSCLQQKYGRKTLLRGPPEAVLECFNQSMTGFFRLAVFFLACMSGLANVASATQDPAPVKKAIENWLKTQAQSLPGQVSYEIGNLDRSNQLAPCTAFDISRPSGGQPWGRTNVQVRCISEAGWRVYIPVHIRVKIEYVISARPIAQGQVVVADDLSAQLGDLSELPANIITDPGLAVGKAAATSIPVGRPVRADMLKAITAIRQGQTVKVVSRGPGFAVTNEGRALNNAVEGQVTQVKLGTGQVVSGIAKSNGSVEVNF
jgi:flagella basal body P-ring formation protein FlgA